MDLSTELTLSKKLNNELRRIRQRVDREKNRVKKAKMMKAYRRIFETLV